jgi:hypothetical protein
MILEGTTFYFYLQEGVSDSEWNCRLLVLRLHDTINRIKLFRGLQSEDQYADFSKGREELKAELRNDPFFRKLDKTQRDRLLTGEAFYIGGMNAAAKAAGVEPSNISCLLWLLLKSCPFCPHEFFPSQTTKSKLRHSLRGTEDGCSAGFVSCRILYT